MIVDQSYATYCIPEAFSAVVYTSINPEYAATQGDANSNCRFSGSKER